MTRQITFFCTDEHERQQMQSLASEAAVRGYPVEFSDRPQDLADIAIFSTLAPNMSGANAVLSVIIQFDLDQVVDPEPRVWSQYNWGSFDLGIVPGGIWERLFLADRADNEARAPRLGIYSVELPGAEKTEFSRRVMDLLEAKAGDSGWPTRTLFVHVDGEWREAERPLTRLGSFVRHEGLSLFRYDNAPGFRYTDGDESERYLIEILSKAKDLSESSPELRAAQIDWPSTYHLSAERGNLIRWLPIGPEQSVLEIGSGCGAISRVLGEKGAQVTAVEGSLNRALIGAMRCRDLDNVRVFNANLQDIAPEPAFDIVTLIGVLEYAGRYITHASPWKRMLEMARAFLAPGGTLLVAIENRVGLKYWTGCLEDHGAGRYASIQGYPAHDPVQTFSRGELDDLLKSAGFRDCRFLYPWPDYKLPKVVFDAPRSGMNLDGWIATPFSDYGNQKVNVFNERLAVRSTYSAGLLGEFSNSFLVLASGDRLPATWLPAWQAKAFSVDRARGYWTETVLWPSKATVTKTPLHPARDVPPPPLRFEPKNTERLSGDSLEVAWCEAMMKRDSTLITRILRRYRHFLTRQFGLGIHTLQGWTWLRGEAVDCLARRVVQTPKGLQAIESEWRLDTAVPEDLVVYRALVDIARRQGHWFGQIGSRGSTDPQIIAECMRQLYGTWPDERLLEFEAWERAFRDIVDGKAADLLFPGTGSLSLLLPLSGSLETVAKTVVSYVETAPADLPCELVLVDFEAVGDVLGWVATLEGDITTVRVSDPDMVWWAGASVARGEFVVGAPASSVLTALDIDELWTRRGEQAVTRSPDGGAFISRRQPELLIRTSGRRA